MNRPVFIFLTIILLQLSCNESKKTVSPSFSLEQDLLLVHYDCKTDVDDLHSIAAFASLIRLSKFKLLDYHAVAGTYGIQEGLYVPPNTLFELSFQDNWSDADEYRGQALKKVLGKVLITLEKGGNIWIAEAGQSDFTAELLKAVQEKTNFSTSERIHIVQHSDWNEESTSPNALQFVKKNSQYHKIPDGNVLNNGSPGFNSKENIDWESYLSDEEFSEIWQLAIDLGKTYNGVDNRYLNPSIAEGGLDFSDFSEIHYILDLENIHDTMDYFEYLKDSD